MGPAVLGQARSPCARPPGCGRSAPPGGRAVEVGLGAGDGRRLVARLPLGGGPGTGFSIVAVSGLPDTPVESTQPLDVALAAIAAVLDVAGSVVLAIPEVAAALDRPVLKSTTRALLTGVLLDATHTDHLDPSLLDPDQLLRRLGTLLANLLAAPGHAEVTIGGALTLAPHTKPGPDGGTVYGISVSLPEPFPLSSGDLTVSLEADGSWIHPPSGPVPSGLTLDVLHMPASGPPAVRPELTVGGVGVRLARTSGPLLATALTIESVVLSMFADVAVPDGTVHASGGARLELAGLAVGLGGGSDASNPVAGGLLAGGDGSNKPRPRFSPALAIQKHGSDATLISLTAGDGAGPWWVIIQRGFRADLRRAGRPSGNHVGADPGQRRAAGRRPGQPAWSDRHRGRPVGHLPGLDRLADGRSRLGGRPVQPGHRRRHLGGDPGRRPAQGAQHGGRL